MPNLTISYLDHYLHLSQATPPVEETPPIGFEIYDESNFIQALDTLKQGKDVWVWYNQDIRGICAALHEQFTFVKAAGGLVRNADGEYLLIYREGHWDIPKGMVEPQETIANAALREVQEETGISQLTQGPIIAKTYHIYDKYGGWHIKQTTWYQMFTHLNEPTLPQLEEGITECRWVKPNECKQLLDQSFASLRLVSQHLNP